MAKDKSKGAIGPGGSPGALGTRSSVPVSWSHADVALVDPEKGTLKILARPRNVPVTTLEATVQMAALLMNREGGQEPSGAYLLQKCGQIHIVAVNESAADPDAVRAWACAEARRRSVTLNHKEIVSQQITH